MSLVLVLLLLVSCAPEEKREYWGSLYFGIGAYLGQLDLRDGSVSLLANLGDTSIREIDAFGDEQLLLTVFGPVNHENKYRLMQYEFDSSGLVTLINGRHGRFLPVPEALIFDDGAHLKARVYGGREMEQLSIARHRFGSMVHILQVADTRIIYSIDPSQTIHLFDIETQESQPLLALSARCRIDGSVWIAGQDTLLCKRVGESVEYVFMSLEGEEKGTLAITDAAPFRAVAHLDDQDALVLTEEWQAAVSNHPRYAIWIYDLHNDHMVRLARDQSVGSHVVYSAK